MAFVSGGDFERSVRLLADGFTALRNEYKSLAEQHHGIKTLLATSTRECNNLRNLVPKDTPQSTPTISLSQPDPQRKRNLDEWLTEMSNPNDAVASDAHTQIRDAELAYFKIQDTLKNAKTVEKPRASRAGSYRSLQPILEQKRAEQAGQMELDFTLPGTEGKLGCPFATIPTPRTSRSHSEVGGIGRRSKRASFHDPLSDTAKSRVAVSSVVSIESDTGPACPIRFLNQHSPEDIAKYFEEHKHELPRSHEVCVKRFQANADSIKQLDAKYGSLVNMIQDLGHKHQPMLPEAPLVDGDDEDDENVEDEDGKSHQNIENWAKTVGEDFAVVEVPEAKCENPDDEERVQRFDRPLKEIRVGESPSRPWGVPIPLRYLDRNTSFADSIARPPLEAPEGLASPVPKLNESMVVHADSATGATKPIAAQNEPASDERPKGKCPFDHATMRTKAAGEAEATLPKAAAEKHPAPTKAPDVVTSPIPAIGTPQVSLNSTPTIFNYGIAVVGHATAFTGHTMVNHGTLIMGYDEENLRLALRETVKPKDA